jgi:hypothetical protein
MVVQYRLAELIATSERPVYLPSNPTLPRVFICPDNKLVRVSHQGHTEQERLFGKLFQPAVVRKLRVMQPELSKAF